MDFIWRAGLTCGVCRLHSPRSHLRHTRALFNTELRLHDCVVNMRLHSRCFAAQRLYSSKAATKRAKPKHFIRWQRWPDEHGDYSLAFKYLDRAIELSDQNSAVRMKCGNTRGLCLVAMGEWTAAEREFRSALQSAEERNDERYMRLIAHNLGTPAGIRGDFGEALRWFSRMLRSDRPGSPMPQEAVAHLNMARCYIYRGDFSSAERASRQCLGAVPALQSGRGEG